MAVAWAGPTADLMGVTEADKSGVRKAKWKADSTVCCWGARRAVPMADRTAALKDIRWGDWKEWWTDGCLADCLDSCLVDAMAGQPAVEMVG